MVSIAYCNKRYRSINRLQLQNLGIKPKTIGTLKKHNLKEITMSQSKHLCNLKNI